MTRTSCIKMLSFFVFIVAIIMISKAEANQLNALNKEINKNPNNYQAHFNLAGELLRLKDYQGAAKIYQFLIDENKILRLPIIKPFRSANQFLGRIHMGLGFALDFLNEDDRAIHELDAAVEIDPQLENHLMLQTTLGAIYGDLGIKEKELDQYQKVIEIDPKFYQAYFNLAIALGETGKITQAITVLERVIIVKPDYAKAYNQLGIAHEIIQNPDKSIEYYLIAQKLYSKMNDEESLRNINRRLKELYRMISSSS
jgi:tetratricopeptide (TPR) repeat protein